MSVRRYSEYKDSGVEWLGEVPGHWEVFSLRHCLADIFNGLTATQIEESDLTVPVTRIETISDGVINAELFGFISEVDARENRRLVKGDILFSNINSLKVIGNSAQYLGGRTIYAGMNLLVLRPSNKIVHSWLLWLIKSSPFRQVVESLAKPAINQASISQQSLLGVTVLVPTLSEQRTIATFLDNETSKIDALVEEQEKLITLLKEKRQAVISHAVTKGLDPAVPMKDSGIEWLGEVPEHWDVVPLKTRLVFQEGPGIMASDFIDDGIPLLRIAGLSGDEATLDGCNFLDPAKVAQKWGHFAVRIGDYLLSASASVGSICKVTHATEGAIPYTGIIRLWPRTRDVRMGYMQYFIRSRFFEIQIDRLKTGVSIEHFGPTHLKRMMLPVPPSEEQSSIATFLEHETGKISSLFGKAENAMALLNERRSALISAAVTGKIDVRGLVAEEVSV